MHRSATSFLLGTALLCLFTSLTSAQVQGIGGSSYQSNVGGISKNSSGSGVSGVSANNYQSGVQGLSSPTSTTQVSATSPSSGATASGTSSAAGGSSTSSGNRCHIPLRFGTHEGRGRLPIQIRFWYGQVLYLYPVRNRRRRNQGVLPRYVLECFQMPTVSHSTTSISSS